MAFNLPATINQIGEDVGELINKVDVNTSRVEKVTVPDTIWVLAMGQSNCVGASPDTVKTGFEVRPGVQVYNPNSGFLETPVQGQEPFNPSGSNNAPLWFCNRIADEFPGVQVNMVLVGTGSTSISAWVGTRDNRTINSINRPRWTELENALSDLGNPTFDAFVWIQGEADTTMALFDYRSEFEYMINELDLMGALSNRSVIVPSQLQMGWYNRKGSGTSRHGGGPASRRIMELARSGDSRVSVASSIGVQYNPTEQAEGIQSAATHFTEQGLTTLGYERIYNAFMMGRNGISFPFDGGLHRTRLRDGDLGSMRPIVKSLANNEIWYPDQWDMGGTALLRAGSIVIFPDFSSSTYSSEDAGFTGWCLDMYMVNVGTATLQIRAGGPGQIVARNGASLSHTVSGPAGVYSLQRAFWDGMRWNVIKL